MKEITLSPKLPIIIKGKRQTASQIESCHFDEDTKKYVIRFKGTNKAYSYKEENIKISVPFGYLLAVAGYLPHNRETEATETTAAPNNQNDSEERQQGFLERELSKIDSYRDNTVLASYLNGKPIETRSESGSVIYPFGNNLSQIKAVRQALRHNISLIEGPPGTGKTQTILNIIANLIKNRKTVGVVSGNNSATANIGEKLQTYGYGNLVAELGNEKRRESYFSKKHSPVGIFALRTSDISETEQCLDGIIARLEEQHRLDNRKAEIRQQKETLLREWDYFRKNSDLSIPDYVKIRESLRGRKYEARKWLRLARYCESWRDRNKYSFSRFAGCLDDMLIYAKTFFGYRIPLTVSNYKDVLILADCAYEMFYQTKLAELDKESDDIAASLKRDEMDNLVESCGEMSRDIFRYYLNRYIDRSEACFTKDNYTQQFERFTRRFPVIMSTTHSIRQSIPKDFIFDYIIIDEASQVDLITASIAMSCCKNIVIVGDSMQLPQIVPSEVANEAKKEARRVQLPPEYDYVDHSIISSLKALYQSSLPVTLLKEHYRCHPLIIGFCNQQYYNKELIIKSEWTEPTKDMSPLVIKTVHHSPDTDGKKREDPCAVRKLGKENKKIWVNELEQRKVWEEFDRLRQRGITDVGVITPFRNHADAIHRQRADIEADTIHKFQGREKDVIIFSTVKDYIQVKDEEKTVGEKATVDFINQSELVNVAVSRAKKQLVLVMSQHLFEQAPLATNIGNLIRYVRYNKGEIEFPSIFDYLYSENLEPHRERFLQRLFGSRYASENLTHELILQVIGEDKKFANFRVMTQYPLRRVVKPSIMLTERQRNFIHRSSHLDFLIYNNTDREPVLAVEVNGKQHDLPKQQERDSVKAAILNKCGIPLLTLKTTETKEKSRIKQKLLSCILHS